MPAHPGWYPDPGAVMGYRWWDGREWTAHTYGPVPPGGGSLAGLAWTGIGVWVAANLVAIGYPLLEAGPIHRAFAAFFHGVNYASEVGAPLPSLSDYYQVPAFYYLVQIGGLAGMILLAVWQNRAAHRARWLGYPARHSPVLGAWGWFIPVANLWLPYQAIRDCLPPGHPERAVTLRAFLAWLLSPLAGLAAAVVAVAADRVAVTAVVALIDLALLALAGGGLARVVSTIDRLHRGTAPASTFG